MNRGAFFVFEGCDKVGKTTQCQKLAAALKRENSKYKLLKFPDRSSTIGKVIDDYLNNRIELEDHAVHLLFSSNRWESVPEMKQLLHSGTSLIVDRYAYSGVAYSAAKQLPNTPLGWYKHPDVGLPAPDVVFYLYLPAQVTRNGYQYDAERYEKAEFQAHVSRCFERLKDDSWHMLDASSSIEDIHKEVYDIVKKTIQNKSAHEIGQLWMDQKKE